MNTFRLEDKQHQYIPFPELGHGGQFRAYDMHDGRVLKLPLTEEETYQVARLRINDDSDVLEDDDKVRARVLTFINGKARIPAMIQHNFLQPQAFLEKLGNPLLIPTDDILPHDTPHKRWGAGRVIYTQDKAEMASTILNRLSMTPRLGSDDIRHIGAIIDTYIEQIYASWEYGYADYVFKLGDMGFTNTGSMFFVDLGEFSSDLEFMERAIIKQRWRHALNPAKKDFAQIPRQAQEYYSASMSNALTINELRKRWRTKHVCSDCKPKHDVITTFIAAKVAEIDYVDRW